MNQPEFHRGHSQLAEFLVAGQCALCVTCYAHHPNAALLWARWVAGEEGQQVYAQAGETPAHPHVEPIEKIRSASDYMLSQDDVKDFSKYEKLWKEIF